MSANFSFYCRSSKANRYGYSPVELSIIIAGKRCFINLPRKEKPEVFKKQMTAKQNNPIREYVAVQMNVINNAITDILSSGKPLTCETLKDYLQNGGIKIYSLADLFNDYFKILDRRCTYENYKKYELVRDEFFSFVGDKNKPLVNISNSDIQGFYAQINRQYKASTAAGKMAKLKCVFRYALDNNKMQVNIFSNIRLTKPKPSIEYLTETDVKNLQEIDFGIDRLNKVRDLFLFQCGSGLAYSDMANLRPSDIQVDKDTIYIKKCRQKTNIEYTAVLLPFAVEILKKYEYTLPLLSNQKMNAYLGEIETLSKIGKRLHSHLGRKTYATYLLNHNISISVVSKCLGHANTNITQSVYAHLQTQTILNEIGNIIS